MHEGKIMSSTAKDARWEYALKIADTLHIEWDVLEYIEHEKWLEFGQYLYERHGTP